MNENISKLLAFVLLSFLMANVASALGVTYPYPQNIELKPGQSSYFTFQIQTDNFPVSCVPSIGETGGLELAFAQKYDIESNQRYNVKPQVIVPKQTGFGNYKTTFCIECTPSNDVSGSRIIPKVCNLPVTVNIVSDRTRTNALEETGNVVWIIVLISFAISIVILASIIFYLVVKQKKRAS